MPLDRPRVQSVARAIQILQLIARCGADGMSPADVGAETGLPRQTVYHLIHTLTGSGMLRKGRGSTYALGSAVGSLIDGFNKQTLNTERLRLRAERAASDTGEAAYIVGWRDGDITVLATARGSAPIQAAELPLGAAGDAHARASGKLLLSSLADPELRRYLEAHPMRRRTPNTLTTYTAIKRQLQEVRGCGVAVEREEYAEGLSCLAVPVGAEPWRLALCISAPSARFDKALKKNLRVLHRISTEVD